MQRYIRQHRLDKGMKGWIVTFARRNYWRVASWYDLDDLIQDGYVCYCRCNEKYKHVREQAHFMALVKITFCNHIHDLATARTRAPDALLADVDPEMSMENLMGSEPESATFGVLLKQLPTELSQLIGILMNDAKAIPMLKYADGIRESTNHYLCRLIGANPDTLNVEAYFRNHFLGA